MDVTVPSEYLGLLRLRAAEAERLARETNKASVLVIQQFPIAEDHVPLVPPVRESIANILGFVEIGTPEQLMQVLEIAGATFDLIALDCDQKLPASPAIVACARQRVPAERLLFYSDNQAWVDSAVDMVQRLEGGITGRSVLLCGTGALADQLALILPRLGALLVSPDESGAQRAEVILGASQKRVSVEVPLVDAMRPGASIYDVGIGNISAAAADRARERQLRLYRLDNRAGISSAVVRLLETDHMVRRLMGMLRVRDVDIVAGGVLAPPGAVVVDDIQTPTIAFGISDGAGRFRPQPLSSEDQARLDFVKSLMVTVS
jgi:hypothetical protein